MKINVFLTLALTLFLSVFLSTLTFAAGGGGVVTSDPSKHFDSKGKMPSRFTIELQNGLRKTLPYEDERDFAEAQKGFIAAPEYKQIMAEAGNVAWYVLSCRIFPWIFMVVPAGGITI